MCNFAHWVALMRNFDWEDAKTCYYVAKLGSLAKAAEQLRINHSTALRHVNRFEQQIECKVFFRHARGYQLTDAGRVLLSEFPEVQNRFHQLVDAMRGTSQRVQGALRITTLPEYASFLHPALKTSLQRYPELRITVDASDDIVPLESGEAHLSIRGGRQPQQPDLIVRKLFDIRFSYYATAEYLQRYGSPTGLLDVNQHQWIMPTGRKTQIPLIKAVLSELDSRNIVYQSNNFADIQSVIETGIAIGPIDDMKALHNKQLTRINSISAEHDSALWYAYHRELRNDLRIKAFVSILEAQL